MGSDVECRDEMNPVDAPGRDHLWACPGTRLRARPVGGEAGVGAYADDRASQGVTNPTNRTSRDECARRGDPGAAHTGSRTALRQEGHRSSHLQ